MIYTTTVGGAIDFSPETVADEVAQNIRMILSTSLGSAPLARDIGLDHSSIDAPLQVTQALLTSAVIAAIHEQEPRAAVIGVSFGATEEIKLRPIVTYTLVEEGSA